MASKRFFYQTETDSDQQITQEKRAKTKPTFASVIGEAIMVNSVQKLCFSLEPLIRKVVNEEIEKSLKRCSRTITKSPSLTIRSIESQSSLQLIFSDELCLPIFTNSKIVDAKNSPLQIFLLDTRSCQIATSPTFPIKIELVALDGDFLADGRTTWSCREFNDNILKERTGKRPLLAGDCLTITMRDGVAPVGEIEFTDNSSWIRSRKFRIGARAVNAESNQRLRIREAVTEAFKVKDHRGELYKKHHPPALGDEVWRLEKIGKDGAFHRKLASSNINTVQDFLKLSTVDPQKLRRVLGHGMSEKMWEVTIKHARTCVMGNKQYVYRRPDCIMTLNPICQLVNATINGHIYSTTDLSNINRGYIENLVRQAYTNWNSLEEIVGNSSHDNTLLLTQGNEFQGQQQIGFVTDHHRHDIELSNLNAIYNDW